MSSNLQLPTAAGVHDVTLALDGLSVKATMQIPAAPRDAPLVLVLHYGGTPQGFYGRPLLEDLFAPAWHTLGAVIVAPVSQGGDWTTPANTEAVLRLLAAVEANYGCDRQRRVVAGYSLGAIGSWHLIGQVPEYFSAAVPLAGRAPSALPPTQTPCYVLHSHADQLFPASEVQLRLTEMTENGREVHSQFLSGVGHFDFGAYREALESIAAWLPDVWSRSTPN